jgi:uncharacterized protein YqgC (DUF456 family)
MKLTLVAESWLLLGVSIVLWLGITAFEAAFVGMSLGIERLITFVGLVLLPAIGAVLGGLSLVRKEARTWLAILGTVLSALFALFQLAVILFAG